MILSQPRSVEKKRINFWRWKFTVLGYDISNTNVENHFVSQPSQRVLFVYSIPQLSRSNEIYAFELNIL